MLNIIIGILFAAGLVVSAIILVILNDLDEIVRRHNEKYKDDLHKK